MQEITSISVSDQICKNVLVIPHGKQVVGVFWAVSSYGTDFRNEVLDCDCDWLPI